jgi:hypothetical protein
LDDIRRFWDWFSSHAQDIWANIESDPDHWAFRIHEHLVAIHPDLVFDIPFELQEGNRELILSADGDASLFPLVDAIHEAAPSIQGWTMHALRPRTDQMDQAIELDGLYLEYEDLFFCEQEEELPLDLTIYIRGYDNEDQRYIHAYFLLLDTLLGERDAVVYTETTAVHPYEGQPEAKRFLELRTLFDSLVQKKN